ncbi:amidohydrolase family protein [Flavobacteriaceae bacterium TP-CH-4]|uniref:Amidohydrolase family protein n=1 Tax=Pelagihabitans pacificus TaxID=2696054 RepID=A0A967EC34_9FLAO|nr:amidohydrolase family protein [Pelagihabitans pacificus]NHF57858.1 amidohydrolase family protein [Pelagihabitans pacificus]
MKNCIYVLIALIGLIACKSDPNKKSSEEAQTVPIDEQTLRKIDVHAHYRHARGYLPTLFNNWNMKAVLVDVAREDSTGVVRSWTPYLDLAQAQPDLFYLCSSLIGVGIDDPDFARKNIERLSQEIDAGAKMVKVWKNFGMVTKDASGNFIQIDDTRLQPIWDFLKDKGIPVMAHIAEPLQAWRPLDPTSPHYGYYKNNPQYHAYKIPEIPSYETIIAARDRWIENNPDLEILCAHIGSMSHDVDLVAERLDKFPNMQVELAARFGDLAKQDSEKVRRFFEKYQDRILFGSDYGNSEPADEMTPKELENEQKDLNASYERLWKYLSSSDSLELRGQQTVGLELPMDVLQKVYFQNTANFLSLQ